MEDLLVYVLVSPSLQNGNKAQHVLALQDKSAFLNDPLDSSQITGM